MHAISQRGVRSRRPSWLAKHSVDRVCAVTKICFICLCCVVLFYLCTIISFRHIFLFFSFLFFVFIHDFVRYHTTWNGNSGIGSGFFSSSLPKSLEWPRFSVLVSVSVLGFVFFSFRFLSPLENESTERNGMGMGMGMEMGCFERGVWCSTFFVWLCSAYFYLEIFISWMGYTFPYRFGLIRIVLFYYFP